MTLSEEIEELRGDCEYRKPRKVTTILTTASAFLQTTFGYLATVVIGFVWLYFATRSMKSEPQPVVLPSEKEAKFLEALTALSRIHGVGIGTQHELFLMEIGGDEDDFNRTYKMDSEVGLLFD